MENTLREDIKFNCDVSDAKYWGYYSVCGLLMRYRDLYRSEKDLKPWSEINRADIGAWIEKKEARWPELEQTDFRDLAVNGRSYKPFDVSGINRELTKQGLVYGAGYGMYLKPSFFLAELTSVRETAGLTVYTSGKELVRDLFTAPGMLQGKTVFLRLEPLVLLLLYKHSELNTRRVSALEDAFSQFGFSDRQIIDSTFAERMQHMAERYAEVLLAHEIAESKEELAEWKNILLLAEGDRKAEHYLRAVKDLVADTSDSGPLKKIIETGDRGALGLTVALMEGYRRVLFPELRQAYSDFLSNPDWSAVEQVRRAAYVRFQAERDEIARLYHTGASGGSIIKTINDRIPGSPTRPLPAR